MHATGKQQQQRMYIIIISTCQLTSVREVKLRPLTVENTATNVTNGSEGVQSTLVANGTATMSTIVANGSERVNNMELQEQHEQEQRS